MDLFKGLACDCGSGSFLFDQKLFILIIQFQNTDADFSVFIKNKEKERLNDHQYHLQIAWLHLQCTKRIVMRVVLNFL